MASYLITGASRGIGLTLVTMLAAKSTSEVAKVYAAARSESEALKKVIASAAGRVIFVPLEVTSQDSIKEAAARVDELQAGKGLDVLINNAGIMEAPVQVDQWYGFHLSISSSVGILLTDTVMTFPMF